MKNWQLELNDQEDLIIDQHPHPSFLLSSILQVLFVIVLSLLAVAIFSTLPLWTILIPVGVIGLSILNLLLKFLKYKSSHLIITTERLIDVKGIMGRRVREIPIYQITNLTSSQSLLERFLNCGSLRVEYSGEIGHDDFFHVRRPERIVRFLGSRPASRPPTSTGVPRVSPLDELVKLEELRNRGTLSEQEYDRAKSRLLDQI